MTEDTNSPTESPGIERRWWVISAVLITAFTTLVVWVSTLITPEPVNWTVRTYEVRDDTEVVVTFDLVKPAGKPVRCALQALANNFAVVGAVDVTIPADAPTHSHHEVTLRTIYRAVTGTVDSCAVGAS